MCAATLTFPLTLNLTLLVTPTPVPILPLVCPDWVPFPDPDSDSNLTQYPNPAPNPTPDPNPDYNRVCCSVESSDPARFGLGGGARVNVEFLVKSKFFGLKRADDTKRGYGHDLDPDGAAEVQVG